jgi:hypothetical protein
MIYKVIAVFLICTSVNAAESRSFRRKASDMMQISLDGSSLKQAMDLAFKTSTGLELKPYIDELYTQGKIHLLPLEDGHYGESGEDCVIKDQHYVYEGVFIHLNRNLNIAELSSALIHEASHYKLINFANSGKLNLPISIGELEVFAFSTQYKYISELERLNLVNARHMFGNDASTVVDVMRSAYGVTNKWTDFAFQMARLQLIDFGYPASELDRNLVIRGIDKCYGKSPLLQTKKEP